MRLYAVDAIADGTDYLTPHALNAEAAQVVTRSNRLDRWAFDGRLAHDRIAADAFGRVRRRAIETTQTYAYQSVSVASLVTIPVPDAVGTAWTETITTRGGHLEVSAHVDVSGLVPPTAPTPPALVAINEAYFWRLVVVVNGLRAATSPIVHPRHFGRDVLRAFGHVPVAAGSCLVELFLEVATGDAAAAATITFNDRQILLVEACR